MRGADEAIAAVVERLAPLPVAARGGGFGMDAADVRELRSDRGGGDRRRRRRPVAGLGRPDRRRA